MHVGKVLTVGGKGSVVFVIGELFVAHHPHVVEPFVGPLAPGEMIIGWRFGIGTKKDPSLKVFLHCRPSQANPGFRHIDETDDPIDGGSGLFPLRIKVIPFGGDADDQRTMDSTGIKESFASGKYPTVVGIVDDDCILVKVVSLEVLDCLTDQRIHFGDGACIFGVGVSHFGKIRVVWSEDHFLRIDGLVLMIAEGA